MRAVQKYKITINETQVVLIDKKNLPKDVHSTETNIVAKYTGKSTHLLNYIDKLEKSKDVESLVLYHDNFEKLKKDFLSLFKVVEAAGGLVLNDKNQILFIFRRGFWDLPKGKFEDGETRRECAKREVMEETGISKLQLGVKLCVTNHAFRSKSGKRNIKKTHWYQMYAAAEKLIPQTEEDIEKASWMSKEKFFGKKRKVYINILEVIEASLSNLK